MSTVAEFYAAISRTVVAVLVITGAVLLAQIWFAYRAVDGFDDVHEVERLSLEIAELATLHARYSDARSLDGIEAALDRLGPALARLREGDRLPPWTIHGLEGSRDRLEVVLDRLQQEAGADLVAPEFGAYRRLMIVEQADLFLVEVGRLNAIVDQVVRRGLETTRTALRSAAVALVALLLLLWGLLFALWRRVKLRIFDPLEQAREALARIGAGDLSTRAEAKSPDELGKLLRAINAMARGLQRVTASRAELAAEVARRADAEASLKARNEKLIEINAELDRFAYIASHDLRAPLRGIRHLAEWILDEIGPDASEDSKRYHGLLAGRLDRLDALLDSLLQFNRIGRTRYGVDDVDPERTVREIADLLGVEDRFAITFEGESVPLRTHRPPFELVLRNLVANAVKHHDRESGRVVVRCDRYGPSRVLISVSDDGPGVPPDLQDRIFRMFTTLRPRDTVEGSGMGLAIIRKTVRLYGSRIELVSPVVDGRGAQFRFSWPIRLEFGEAETGDVPDLHGAAIERQASDAANLSNR